MGINVAADGAPRSSRTPSSMSETSGNPASEQTTNADRAMPDSSRRGSAPRDASSLERPGCPPLSACPTCYRLALG